MSDSPNQGNRTPRIRTEGFKAPRTDLEYENRPIYRVVEVIRNSEGRLRHEGRIWHNDLDLLRRFGRAIASNTSSHRVMITDAMGTLIEELPIAQPNARVSAWGRWEDMPLPPAPPRVATRRNVPAPPRPEPKVNWNSELKPAPKEPTVSLVPPPAEAQPEAATASNAPPRDIPRLPLAQSEDADHLAAMMPEPARSES